VAILNYGLDSSVDIETAAGWPPESLEIAPPEEIDVGRSLSSALAEPLDFPPLAQCTMPGDRVVLALDRGLPDAARIVAEVVESLEQAGVGIDGITVLRPQSAREADDEDPRRLLPLSRRHVALATHDPADRRQLAYLAADEAGEAILVNRALHDADVVLTIGCLRAEAAAGYFGVHGTLYPTFSDEKTQRRFRCASSLESDGQRRGELTAQADNVAWLLGAIFSIQLLPAGGGRTARVLAGRSDSVARRGRELYAAAWDRRATQRGELVVAAIEGDAVEQSWDNFGRALQAAEHFVAADGAIAVCCELADEPGPALRHLALADSPSAALKHIGHHRPVDALTAVLLAHALRRHKVYLLSRLDPATVEQWDVIPLQDAGELGRLARRHPTCTLLPNAPYIHPRD
jgi:nickel-dependent lactate racemase